VGTVTRAKHKGRTPAREWTPLYKAMPVPMTEAQCEALVRECMAMGYDEPAARAAVDEQREEENSSEMWRNDQVVVHVERSDAGWVWQLGIRRVDRKPLRDWRVFQQIKNELCGFEAEAVELFPADARLVDTANHYWLWCLPPGERFPFGFQERVVNVDGVSLGSRARQRPMNGVGAS